MKKHLGLLFFGLFITAAGIGCFSAAFNKENIKEAEAKTDYLEFEDGVATLGRYPQTITDVDVDLIKSDGTLNPSTGWYTYQNKQYAIHTVRLDEEYLDNEKFNDGSYAKDVNESEKAFLVEDLKWEILEIGNGYVDLITTRIIDRQTFDDFGNEYYPITTIREFNNSTFLESAFTESEKTYLLDYFEYEYRYKINLPTQNQLIGYLDAKLEYPSDYAITSYLSGNPEGGETYTNGPFWTRTKNMRIIVFWSGPHQTECLLTDPKIGLRPVIRVAYNNRPIDPQSYTVSFDANGGSGKMKDVTVTTGEYILPECSFTPPTGKTFSNWEVKKQSYNPGDKITIKENLTILSIWKDKESGGGGGGGTTPKKTNTGSINVTLALGITLTVVGAGGLIAFFIVWGKKHPTGKPPVWIIITIAGSLVVSIVGLSCLASGISGGGGGAGCFNYGYYVQTGTHSGNGIVQVGTTAWLIKSDGTAYYCSHLKDADNASDFAPDNYMTGTYKISGSKLTITVPKREIQNFGPVGGTFNFTIKNCKYLYSGSVETYHWVRGE